MKLCRTCNTEKEFSEFGKRKASKDGFSPKCRECQKDYDRKRASLPHRVEARKNYLATEKGRLASARAKKTWTVRNTVKRAAHILIGNAVRDGKLIKPSECESCRLNSERLHAHHDDYALPLIVRWLCPGCHNKWHKKNGEGLNSF